LAENVSKSDGYISQPERQGVWLVGHELFDIRPRKFVCGITN